MNLQALAAALDIDAMTHPDEFDLSKAALLPDAMVRPILEKVVRELQSWVEEPPKKQDD